MMEFNDRRNLQPATPPTPKLNAGRTNLGAAFAKKVYTSKKARQMVKSKNPYPHIPQPPAPPK